MPFRFERLAIPEVLLIEPRTVRRQPRPFHGDLQALGIRGRRGDRRVRAGEPVELPRSVCCADSTISARRTHRASSCASSAGKVFDVAVDLRPDSPTSGRWVGVEPVGRRSELVVHPVVVRAWILRVERSRRGGVSRVGRVLSRVRSRASCGTIRRLASIGR